MSMIQEIADQLRLDTAAVRLRKTKFGTTKAMSKQQRESAADVFSADGEFVRASKKLLNTKDDAYKAVTSILSRANSVWKESTVPYPEDGIRLIKRERIEAFQSKMLSLTAELDQAVAALNDKLWELKQEARVKLGSLYNPGDYPDSLEFSIAWEFPSVEPPMYLKELNPRLYEQEQERIKARFEEAVALAETAFVEEFQKLVAHLVEQLSGAGEDGKPKQFRRESFDNLKEFFDRFKDMSVRSNPELDAMVEQCQSLVTATTPYQIKNYGEVRRMLGREMANVTATLDSMLVNRPKRAISLTDE